MANEYLKMKWRTGFKACDIDNSGTVDMDDARLFVDRFTKLHHLEGDKAREIRQKFLALWKEVFLIDGETITESEYLKKTIADYEKDKRKFRERIERFMKGTSDIYDINGDGYLSEDEYLVVIQCHGVTVLDRKYIRAYPQIPGLPGLVHLKEYVDSWVAYMTNDDKENIGKEKPCLIGYNLIPSD